MLESLCLNFEYPDETILLNQSLSFLQSFIGENPTEKKVRKLINLKLTESIKNCLYHFEESVVCQSLFLCSLLTKTEPELIGKMFFDFDFIKQLNLLEKSVSCLISNSSLSLIAGLIRQNSFIFDSFATENLVEKLLVLCHTDKNEINLIYCLELINSFIENADTDQFISLIVHFRIIEALIFLLTSTLSSIYSPTLDCISAAFERGIYDENNH